jgi:hypothetical protein
MEHRSGGTHIDGYAQGQIFRLHFQRTEARFFFRLAHRGNHSGRAAGTLLVHLLLPSPQLLAKICRIVKPPHLEQEDLTKPTRFSTLPFC